MVSHKCHCSSLEVDCSCTALCVCVCIYVQHSVLCIKATFMFSVDLCTRKRTSFPSSMLSCCFSLSLSKVQHRQHIFISVINSLQVRIDCHSVQCCICFCHKKAEMSQLELNDKEDMILSLPFKLFLIIGTFFKLFELEKVRTKCG